MRHFFEQLAAVKPRSSAASLAAWQDVEEGRLALADIPEPVAEQPERLSPFALAALPVSPGVSESVLRAHEEQIERNQRTQRAEAPIPGRVTWSGHIGKFVFEPEDPSLGDFLAGGVAVKLSITT
jgi:hypothetical protein